MQHRGATAGPKWPSGVRERWFLWVFDRLQATLRRRSTAGSRPFFNACDFAWARTLERDHPAIRAEFTRLFAHPGSLPPLHEIAEDQKPLGDDDRWRTFFLMASGHAFPDSMAMCPDTTRAIRAIPGAHTAFFSILMPGRTIPLHRGPFCGCIRAHLGVVVPEPESCGIYVHSEEGRWREGGVLLLDDSYMHMAWNRGTLPRAVLIVDVVRDMGWPWKAINAMVLGLIARGRPLSRLIARYADWERATARGS